MAPRNDIVLRLRTCGVSTPEMSLLQEAADEIENLRQQVVSLSFAGHNETMSERYDIRPNLNGEWEVVDTGNRYAPTGHVYKTREEALAKAKEMG